MNVSDYILGRGNSPEVVKSDLKVVAGFGGVPAAQQTSAELRVFSIHKQPLGHRVLLEVRCLYVTGQVGLKQHTSYRRVLCTW